MWLKYWSHGNTQRSKCRYLTSLLKFSSEVPNVQAAVPKGAAALFGGGYDATPRALRIHITLLQFIFLQPAVCFVQ